VATCADLVHTPSKHGALCNKRAIVRGQNCTIFFILNKTTITTNLRLANRRCEQLVLGKISLRNKPILPINKDLRTSCMCGLLPPAPPSWPTFRAWLQASLHTEAANLATKGKNEGKLKGTPHCTGDSF
jgi:hypothetical protein